MQLAALTKNEIAQFRALLHKALWGAEAQIEAPGAVDLWNAEGLRPSTLHH